MTLYPNHRSAARLQALLGSGPGGDLGAGGEAEFGEDAFDVALGGAWGDDQFGGDLPVAQALGEQFGDLVFPGGQYAWGVSRGGRRARGGGLFAQCVGDGLIKAEIGAALDGRGIDV